MSCLLKFALSLLCAGFVCVANGQCTEMKLHDLQLEDDMKGLQIHSCDLPGCDVDYFVAEITVNADLASVQKVLEDVGKYNEWQEPVTDSRLVQKTSESSAIIYVRIRPEFLFFSETFKGYYKVHKTEGEGSIQYCLQLSKEHQEQNIPESDERIEESLGKWIIEEVSPDTTLIRYEFYLKPPNQPCRIVNKVSKDSIRETLLNLQKLVTG
ncbi:hypothetical protein [Sanyastnella coralliicola]|uniref:hypothetical protein n=1 Tax=Sanyastnella coralliicola TaxID=3069118 RepID=UPI0027BAA398|nr:hypothetical protein [Longitalea sp. SCSIO 12813]